MIAPVHSKKAIALWLLIPFIIFSCGKKSGGQLFTLMPASTTHADFVNNLDFEK
jgi:hypothetical protein